MSPLQGKAALAMAGYGWQVTAVEPGEPMLAVLRDRAAGLGLSVATVNATAEATTLPSDPFELATAAEAYHWFDAPTALREIARIVGPEGGLAFFWNVRDVEASPLLAEYEALGKIVGAERAGLRRPGPREETRREILDSGRFEEPAFEQLRHEVEMTGGDLIGLAFTASHVRMAERAPGPVQPRADHAARSARRHQVDAGLRALCDRLLDRAAQSRASVVPVMHPR